MIGNVRKELGLNPYRKICRNCVHVKFRMHDKCKLRQCYVDIFDYDCPEFEWDDYYEI